MHRSSSGRSSRYNSGRYSSRRSIGHTSRTKAASRTEYDDIGRQNLVEIHVKDVKDVPETNIIETIGFSTDKLQYLIKNAKFTVNQSSPSSKTVWSLSINDSSIPLLHSMIQYPKIVQNLIVQITIKNIFDAYRFIYPNPEDVAVKESLLIEYEHITPKIKSY